MQEPTSNEIANILHKRVIWILCRGENWTPNLTKYPMPNPTYPHTQLLYKVLFVVDNESTLEHSIVAECMEFCDYWVAQGYKS